MRGLAATRNHVVPLLEGFNFIGNLIEPKAWDESEASAIRLGNRGQVDRGARQRGLKTAEIMRGLAESGVINLIYTDDQRRRVPYFQSVGYRLTAIYPDPVGTGVGMIELDDRYIYDCLVDIRQIFVLSFPKRPVKTGPRRGFTDFDAALDDYFRNNPITNANAEVMHALGQTHAGLQWPGKTVMHERINESRDRAKALASAGTNSGRTPDGQ